MASLFTTQTPTGVNNDDGAPGITFGISLMFAVAGTVSAVRFFSTTTVSGTYTAGAWEVTGDDDPGPGTGTLLESEVLGSAPSTGAWNNIPLSPSVSVVPGTLYRFAVHSSAGRYVNKAGDLSVEITNGDITAPASGTDPDGLGTLRQGVFAINAALTYPATTGNGTNYFADVVFTATSTDVVPDGLAVPAALGAPTVGVLAPAPNGLAVAVSLGSPSVSLLSSAPAGLAVAVGLGAPSIGATTMTPVAPDGITVPVTLGEPTSEQGPATARRATGWSTFGNALRFNADELRREQESPPVDCPNDGEPLEQGPGGVLHCRADGWEWPARRVVGARR